MYICIYIYIERERELLSLLLLVVVVVFITFDPQDISPEAADAMCHLALAEAVSCYV